VNLAVGTITPGSTAVLNFQVTVNATAPSGASTISNQGTVTSSAPTVLTDDPDTVAANDPTITPIVHPTAANGVVSGRIVSDSGLPVEGAVVNLSGGQTRKTITDADVTAVIKKQIKQRQDSIEGFEKGGRADLVDKEKAELAILKSYLPEELSQTQLEEIIKASIAEVGATVKADMGKVMKAVQTKTAGRADYRDRAVAAIDAAAVDAAHSLRMELRPANDVGRFRTAGDQARMLINARIPNPPS